MAKLNNLVALGALFFAVLILCQLVLPTEARNLKYKDCRVYNFASNSRNMHNARASISLNANQHNPELIKKEQVTNKKTVETLDDFRPTAPGRSPGAGH